MSAKFSRHAFRWSLLLVEARKLEKLTPPKPEPRMPANFRQEWVARAILLLTADDPDRANERNAVGWNKPDSWKGARWAGLLSKRVGLTAEEWGTAEELLRKYRGQLLRAGLGEMPQAR